MKYRIEFEIEYLPKTPNTLLGRHWRGKANHALVWKRLVEQQVILKGGFPPAPIKKAKVTMTRFSSTQPDEDGLYGSFKPVLDALTNYPAKKPSKKYPFGMPAQPRVLVDDSPAHIELQCLWGKAKRRFGKVHVLIEEI